MDTALISKAFGLLDTKVNELFSIVNTQGDQIKTNGDQIQTISDQIKKQGDRIDSLSNEVEQLKYQNRLNEKCSFILNLIASFYEIFILSHQDNTFIRQFIDMRSGNLKIDSLSFHLALNWNPWLKRSVSILIKKWTDNCVDYFILKRIYREASKLRKNAIDCEISYVQNFRCNLNRFRN